MTTLSKMDTKTRSNAMPDKANPFRAAMMAASRRAQHEEHMKEAAIAAALGQPHYEYISYRGKAAGRRYEVDGYKTSTGARLVGGQEARIERSDISSHHKTNQGRHCDKKTEPQRPARPEPSATPPASSTGSPPVTPKPGDPSVPAPPDGKKPGRIRSATRRWFDRFSHAKVKDPPDLKITFRTPSPAQEKARETPRRRSVTYDDDRVKVQFDTAGPMPAADVMRERTPVPPANKDYYTTTYGSAFNHAKPSYGVASPISSKERFKPPVPTYGTSNGPSRKLPMGLGPVDRAGSRISTNLRPRSRATPADKTSGPIRADHSVVYQSSMTDKYGHNNMAATGLPPSGYNPHSTSYDRRHSMETVVDLKNRNRDVTNLIHSKNTATSLPDIAARNMAAKKAFLLDDKRSKLERRNSLSDKGTTGLRNLGNTCFLNSIVQCLSNCRPLLDYTLQGEYAGHLNPNSPSKGNTYRAFAKLIKEIWSGEKGPLNTRPFLTKLSGSGDLGDGRQHDAQECLMTVIDKLHEDINKCRKKQPCVYLTEEEELKLSESEKGERAWAHFLKNNQSKMADLFAGQLKSTLTCSSCGYNSVTFDPFFDLNLPIPQKSKNVSIEDCLRLFHKEEILDGDNRPTCAMCKTRRKMHKKITVNRFPRILIMQLKRFDNSFMHSSKLKTKVDFPREHLNLSKFAADTKQGTRSQYNLFGVSHHFGSLNGGHYTATCKHPFNGKWHYFNDADVSAAAKQAGPANAYLLFYEMADNSARL